MGRPAFTVYAADLLVDAKVCRLNDAGFRILFMCWCRCCLDGSIPADPKELARVLNLHGNRARILPEITGDFFTLDPENPSRLISERMASEQEKYEATVQRNRTNGSKGGRPKKPTGLILENPKKTNHNHNLKEERKDVPAKRVPKETQKAKTETLEEILQGGKGTPMWEAYWMLVATFGGQSKNPAPKTTARLYADALRAGATQERIQNRAQGLRNGTTEAKFMPQLKNWLEGQGYLTPDLPEAQTNGAQNGKPHHRTATDQAYIAQLAERDARRVSGPQPAQDPDGEEEYLASLDALFSAPAQPSRATG